MFVIFIHIFYVGHREMDYRKKTIVARLNLCVNDILITFFKVGCCSVIINKSTNLQLPV